MQSAGQAALSGLASNTRSGVDVEETDFTLFVGLRSSSLVREPVVLSELSLVRETSAKEKRGASACISFRTI